MLQATNMDILDHLTISKLAFEYAIKRCGDNWNNIYPLKGIPLKFI